MNLETEVSESLNAVRVQISQVMDCMQEPLEYTFTTTANKSTPYTVASQPVTIPNILKNTDSLEVVYPWADDFTKMQLSVFWLPHEIKVEKDIQDIKVNMTEAEKHGVITVLKLFTLYELKAGAEYWTGRFKRRFKRPEFQEMGTVFGAFELAVHKKFYQEINKQLHLHTDEFYGSYVNDPVLKSRMDFIDRAISSPDDLVSLAVFSMIEGAILYSSFAFLKHFQSQGKNKMLNVVRGINFSVRDENIHALAGARCFKELKKEMAELMTEDRSAELEETIIAAARELLEHEFRIVDMIFEKGTIDGITSKQLKNFVESRINECLVSLGYKKIFDVTYNPIAGWFYKAISDFVFNDTFSGVGSSYHRNWDETSFIWEDYRTMELQ